MIVFLSGKDYASDEEVKTAVINSTDFYEAEIHVLIRRWNIAFERNDDYVKK